MKKKVALLLSLLICSGMLFALTVRSYSFNIDGKTREDVFRRMVQPKEVEVFESEEELETALAKKLQKILNTRLVLADYTSYSYSIDGDSVDVEFDITDAKSFLVLPYPKYDSNDGLSLGLRCYEKNLMGTHASVLAKFDATAQLNDLKHGVYYADIPLENLVIGSATYEAGFQTLLDAKNSYNSYVLLHFAESGYEIGQLVFNVSTDASFRLKQKKFDLLSGVVTQKNLALGKFAKLGSSVFASLSQTVPTNSTAGASVSFYDIKWGDATIEVTPGMTVKKNPSWGWYSLYNETTIDLTGDINGFILKDVMTLYNGDAKTIVSENSAAYKVDEKTTVAALLNASYGKGRGLHNKQIGFQINSSFGEINYIGAFRKGYSFDLDVKYLKSVPEPGYFCNGSIDWSSFMLAGNVFNPNIRLKFYKLSSMTRMFNNIDLGTTPDDLQARLRGIRRDNPVVSVGGYQACEAMVINANLPLKFIRFENFAQTYVNFFYDAALFAETSVGAFKYMHCAGFEGVCIFEKYPAYPIRASLGINLDSLKGSGNPEYELFIGMGWLY